MIRNFDAKRQKSSLHAFFRQKNSMIFCRKKKSKIFLKKNCNGKKIDDIFGQKIDDFFEKS